jgi:transposase
VVEIDRPKRPRGRHGAKSDVLDAIRAGREALARDHLTTPRQRGHREALRVLHTTRAAIVAAGADARRQLKALIVTAPSRCGTACGGGPGASSSAPAPSWSPHRLIRWSTRPRCGRFA